MKVNYKKILTITIVLMMFYLCFFTPNNIEVKQYLNRGQVKQNYDMKKEGQFFPIKSHDNKKIFYCFGVNYFYLCHILNKQEFLYEKINKDEIYIQAIFESYFGPSFCNVLKIKKNKMKVFTEKYDFDDLTISMGFNKFNKNITNDKILLIVYIENDCTKYISYSFTQDKNPDFFEGNNIFSDIMKKYTEFLKEKNINEKYSIKNCNNVKIIYYE
jgi:hypothetical protein